MQKLNVERLLMPWNQRSLHGEQELDTEEVLEMSSTSEEMFSFFCGYGRAIASRSLPPLPLYHFKIV